MTFLAALLLLVAVLNVVCAVLNVRNARRNKANAQANLSMAKHLQRAVKSPSISITHESDLAAVLRKVSRP